MCVFTREVHRQATHAGMGHAEGQVPSVYVWCVVGVGKGGRVHRVDANQGSGVRVSVRDKGGFASRFAVQGQGQARGT